MGLVRVRKNGFGSEINLETSCTLFKSASEISPSDR